MANTTSPRRTPQPPRRTGQPSRATGNARTGFTPRPGFSPRGRSKPAPQSTAQKVLSSVTGALPSANKAKTKAKTTKAKAKAKTPGKAPGGLALLAGAGGLAAALSQRDKLKGLVAKRGSGSATTVSEPFTPPAGVSPADGVAPITDGPAGTQPGPNAV